MALADQLAQGIQFAPPPDPFAQYGKMQQLQQGQQANQLNQMKMAEYQRAAEETNALRQLDRSSPDYVNQLYRINPTQGLAYEKSQAESKNLALTGQKTQAEIANLGVTGKKTQSDIDKEKFDRQLKIAEIAGSVLNGVIDQATYDQAKRALSHIVSPESLADYPAAYDPKFIASEKAAGQTYTQAQTAANAAWVAATGERTAATGERTAATGESRLAFEKQKFAWEKANPGHELIQNADGEYYAVNKRTNAMTPLMVGGGAAPAAAAPAAGAGVASAGGVPVGRAAAPAGVPAAGVPFVGKAAELTESQGNATAFGMRMKESNSVLKNLENQGQTNTGLVKGVVSGTLGVIPLIGDKLQETTGSVFNSLPQILGGLSPEQQQIANSRINFITAVLRKESGAAISPSEFTTAEKLYFPKPGDAPSVIAQKQKARDLAVKTMEVQAGPGARHIQGYTPTANTSNATVSNW